MKLTEDFPLAPAMAKKMDGDVVVLTIMWKGEKQTVNVTLVERN